MRSTERHDPKSGRFRIPERVLLVARWIAGVGLACSAGAVIALELGWISDPRYLRGALVLALIGLIEMTAETAIRVRDTEAKVNQLILRERAPIHALKGCIEELSEIIKTVKADRIDLRFLGLGFREGKKHVRDLLRDTTIRAHLHVEILLLTGDSRNLGASGEFVKPWCDQTKSSIDQIDSVLNLVEKDSERVARSVAIKQYSEVPFVHGFAITRPVTVVYCSFCRWDEDDTYSWDSNAYRIVRDGSSSRDLATDDGTIFNSFFDHLWRVSGDPVLERSVRPQHPS